jgi:hypothetical protein
MEFDCRRLPKQGLAKQGLAKQGLAKQRLGKTAPARSHWGSNGIRAGPDVRRRSGGAMVDETSARGINLSRV